MSFLQMTTRRCAAAALLAALALLPACRRHSELGAVAKPKAIAPRALPGGKVNPCALLLPADADAVLGTAVRQADLKAQARTALPAGSTSPTSVSECSYSTVTVSPLRTLALTVVDFPEGGQAASAFRAMKDGVRASAGVDPDDVSLADAAYWAGGHDRKLVFRRGAKVLILDAGQGLEKEQRETATAAAKRVLGRM
ncbi:MAG TPA: hypothetical protein VGE98_05085 [Thermoanaerobaculia bacterium]